MPEGSGKLHGLYKDLIDFHGELLLFMHWSILAYLAMVKILKKHYKRTGLLVNAPQLQNLLEQPFCSTEVSYVGLYSPVIRRNCGARCPPFWR